MHRTLVLSLLAILGCRTVEADDPAARLLRELPGSNEARTKVVASMLRDLAPGTLRKALTRKNVERDARALALGSPGWEAAYRELLLEGARVEGHLWDALFDVDSPQAALRIAELLVLIDSPERPPVALLDVLVDRGEIPSLAAPPAHLITMQEVRTSLGVPPLREETTPLQVLKEIEAAEPSTGPFFEQRRD